MDERKIALVTGGSRGIGRAICEELARAGYYVIVNYRSNTQEAEKTLAAVREDSDGELACFDIADSETAIPAVEGLIEKHGAIEALVNNAGVTADGLFIMMPEQDWDMVVNTTLKGFYNITKPILKNMIKKKKGAVVSISSISGIIGNRGQANYSAAKAGLIAATKSAASEVGRAGIRVNAVAPGLIDTDMTSELPKNVIKGMIPMARIGKPEEVAKVVKFLLSDDASYVTGQVLSINGGMC